MTTLTINSNESGKVEQITEFLSEHTNKIVHLHGSLGEGGFLTQSYFIPRGRKWESLISENELEPTTNFFRTHTEEEVVVQRQWEFLTSEVGENDPTVLTDFSQSLRPMENIVENIIEDTTDAEITLTVIGELRFIEKADNPQYDKYVFELDTEHQDQHTKEPLNHQS